MKSKNATSHSVKKKQIKPTSFCVSVRINCFQICAVENSEGSFPGNFLSSFSNFTGLCHILQGWVFSSKSSFSLCSCKNHSIYLFIYSSFTACFSESSIVKYTFTSSCFQLIHKYVKWQTLRLKMLEGRFSVTSLHCESWLFLQQLHFLSSNYSSTGRPFHLLHQA